MAAGPAPRWWSPASPGTRLVVFLLWKQRRGSSVGIVGWGGHCRGEARSIPESGRPYNNKPKGFGGEGNAVGITHSPMLGGLTQRGGKHPSRFQTTNTLPRYWQGGCQRGAKRRKDLNPCSTLLKTGIQGSLGSPSAAPNHSPWLPPAGVPTAPAHGPAASRRRGQPRLLLPPCFPSCFHGPS